MGVPHGGYGVAVGAGGCGQRHTCPAAVPTPHSPIPLVTVGAGVLVGAGVAVGSGIRAAMVCNAGESHDGPSCETTDELVEVGVARGGGGARNVAVHTPAMPTPAAKATTFDNATGHLTAHAASRCAA